LTLGIDLDNLHINTTTIGSLIAASIVLLSLVSFPVNKGDPTIS
jgi:hypothetical protein